MFSSTGYKDSVSNIDATGEFVCNMANLGLKDEMNQTSASVAHEICEFDLAGLEMAASRLVKAPRVAKAVTALECKHLQTLRLKTLTGSDTDSYVVFGQVVGVHIDESVIVDGKVDVMLYKPLSRLLHGLRRGERGVPDGGPKFNDYPNDHDRKGRRQSRRPFIVTCRLMENGVIRMQ